MIIIPVIILSNQESEDNQNEKQTDNDNKKEDEDKNKTLLFLFIDRYPDKLKYKEGELLFDETGLILRALYDDNSNPQIFNYKIVYNTPITLYDRYISFLYEGNTCEIELEIINDENIKIVENYSFEEYILTLKKDCITRFEIEEADISKWIISNSYNQNKIISRKDASKKQFLSGIEKNVLNESQLIFYINLDFDAEIEMSVSYSQNEEFKSYEYDMSLIYKFILDDNGTIEINEKEKYLYPRTDITKWQLIKYNSFKLSKGEHNMTINYYGNSEYGSPNIDYIDFKSFEIKNEEEDIPINDFHTYLQYLYINDSDPTNIYKYAQGIYEISKPKGNILDFSDSIIDDSDSYIIEISEKSNFENSQKIFNLKQKNYIIKNLKLGQKIYYRGAITEKDLTQAKLYEITVNNKGPRNLDVPGVNNFRDIGGYKTTLLKNGIIKQGLYYRSGQINDITKKGKEIVTKDLGIKVEIDLREKSKNTGPYIEGVEYYPIPIDLGNEEERFEKLEEQYYKVFTLISHADINPIILHCMAGADRTGIMTFALLTLLGCEYNDIVRDYLFTNFSNDGYRDANSEFNDWWKKLSQYEGDSKAEQCKNWLISKGLEESKLEHIRNIFIEVYKEN